MDAAARFGLFYWWLFAISASGFLLEIVAMDSLLCSSLLSGRFGL